MTTANTARLPWHPPLIFEFDDREMSPRAGQLVLSSRHPKREHTDREREARMNKEAQDRWRERQYDKQDLTKVNPRTCCTKEYDADILNMLVGTGQIQGDETSDPKEVAKAIYDVLADAARAWKKNH